MLAELRGMLSVHVLRRIAIHLKADPTYVPRKNRESRRWHVLTERGNFEILTTGSKWFDTRERRGGGSAIDLAMHLLGVSFVEAVKRLTDACQPIGAPARKGSSAHPDGWPASRSREPGGR